MPKDDWTLVRQAQRGEKEAFGKLYEHYFDRVYSYVAFRVTGEEVAEDITEQVFVRALEAIEAFQWRGVPLIAWLFRIARNQVIDHCREKARRPTVPLEQVATLAEREPGPESSYERKLMRQELREAVSKLTEAQQQVIALKFTAGLSNAEVASVLNKSEGAVKALQHSALQSLRRQLARKAIVGNR